MCCMAVMGVFSFGVLHTKAAVICDHTVLQSELDIERGYSYEASGHYKVYGTKLSCPVATIRVGKMSIRCLQPLIGLVETFVLNATM